MDQTPTSDKQDDVNLIEPSNKSLDMHEIPDEIDGDEVLDGHQSIDDVDQTDTSDQSNVETQPDLNLIQKKYTCSREVGFLFRRRSECAGCDRKIIEGKTGRIYCHCAPEARAWCQSCLEQRKAIVLMYGNLESTAQFCGVCIRPAFLEKKQHAELILSMIRKDIETIGQSDAADRVAQWVTLGHLKEALQAMLINYSWMKDTYAKYREFHFMEKMRYKTQRKKNLPGVKVAGPNALALMQDGPQFHSVANMIYALQNTQPPQELLSFGTTSMYYMALKGHETFEYIETPINQIPSETVI